MAATRVLIVEDERVVAENLLETLKDLGCDVIGLAATGEDAVQKAVQTQPDLVMMDIVLKGKMDGIEAARIISSRLDVPIVFLSAHTESATLSRAKETGLFGYVVKPYSERDVRVAVEIALYKHMMERDLRAGREALRQANLELEERVRERTRDLVRANESLRREIAERRLAEEALVSSEEKYRLLVENCNEMILVLHGDAVRFANARAMELLGHPMERLSSISFLDLVHPCDRDGVADRHRHPATGRAVPNCYSFRWIDRAGSVRWGYANAVPIDWQGERAILAFVSDISDMKEAEAALMESEARCRELVENANDVIYTHDLEGRYTSANEAAIRLLGYSRKDFGKINFRHVVDPEYLSVAEQNLLRKMQGAERTEPYELLVRAKDGTPIWLEVSTRIIRHRGKPVGVHGIARDITARKSWERALSESEERYRRLVELSPDGIIVHVNGKLIFANSAAAGILGTERADSLMGRDVTDFVHPEYLEATQGTMLNLCEDSDSVPLVEEKLVGVDGRVVDVEVASSFLTFHGSNAVQTVIRDISPRKRAEEALRESEERFRTIFETAPAWMFIKDEELRYTHINPAMLEALGMEAPAALGRSDGEIFGRNLLEGVRDLERRVLSGQVIESEHTMEVNNVRITFNCVRVPIRDSSGRVSGLCGVARDVTEWTRRPVYVKKPPEGGMSKAMTEALNQVRFVAGSESTVLFLGESGSGKDYLARYLHDQSPRAGGPFFTINCAALTAELVESELFGHEAGAFTGSLRRKRGLLELAEGGTLLLNEVGELPHQMQAKLLTFLDSRSFIRVGGERSISVNARLVAATNRDLATEVKTGSFRQDLFYRLNIFTVRVPPLRERIDDLRFLVSDILVSLVQRMGLPGIPSIDDEAMAAMAAYDWPGNVRELRNVLERTLILSRGGRITARHLGLPCPSQPDLPSEPETSFSVRLTESVSMNDALDDAKRFMVTRALNRTGGNIKEAARVLGITRDSLKHHMKSLGIKRRESPTRM